MVTIMLPKKRNPTSVQAGLDPHDHQRLQQLAAQLTAAYGRRVTLREALGIALDQAKLDQTTNPNTNKQ